MSGKEDLSPEETRDLVLDFISAPEPGNFDSLAIRIFRCQYRHNAAYRAWCDSLGVHPESIGRPDDIPAVPTSAFKELEFSCAAPETEFRTSGTTGFGNGRHLLPWLSLYRTASIAHFGGCVLERGRKMRVFALAPSPQLKPESSLSCMLGWIMDEFGLPGSAWLVSERGLERDRLAESLLDAQRIGTPALLLGTSAAFLDFFYYCQRTKLALKLPFGSLLMDTGGQKGSSLPRRLEPAEFQRFVYESAEKYLGLPLNHCMNEYGMTELCSQFYDDRFAGEADGPATAPRAKIGPAWVRTRILDPKDLRPVPAGKSGLLHHLDLANVGSVISVLTEDLGREVPGGFILEGRPRQAEARGCGMTFAELAGAG